MSTLIVIAKAPVPGRVKTRLCPPFTPTQAAALAEASLRDTLAAVAAVPHHAAKHRLLVLDGESGPWLPPGFLLTPQVDGTLDLRLAAAFAAAARIDPGPALLIGMDTPQVTAPLLTESLLAMIDRPSHHAADAVFGPAEDGGFWALGLREPAHPRVNSLLHGVPMSRADTGVIQYARLAQAALRTTLLPLLRDVDTAQDAHLVAALAPTSAFSQLLATFRSNPLPPPTPCWSGPASSDYERALWQSLSKPAHPVVLHNEAGTVLRLDVARYTARPDAADNALLDHCTGPTIDIGCGPGRLAAELARRGVPALGVDVTPIAVMLARAAGATALNRSVFDRIPGEGRWPHALLIDGNIGIGGDPTALLARIKELLKPTGADLIVETAPDEVDERHRLRLAGGGAPIPWARLGTAALRAAAQPLGYRFTREWHAADRRFALLST